MLESLNFIDVLEDIESQKKLGNLLKSEGLCYDDLSEINGELRLALDSNDNVIGAYGLEIFGKNALLRSVVISIEFRGSGRGKNIVAEAIEMARLNGVKQLFLLTTTADKFFAKFGFEVINRNSVPETIAGTTEFKTFCPDTAVCMKCKI